VEPVRIGKVVRAIGLRGLVGVAGTESALARLSRVALRRGEVPAAERRVVSARPQGRVWAVGLEGVDSRESAEALVGCEVLAWREDLGEAGEDRHYWADLDGLPVDRAAGRVVVDPPEGLLELAGKGREPEGGPGRGE
jgi:16S rRNA processing protein RimM